MCEQVSPQAVLPCNKSKTRNTRGLFRSSWEYILQRTAFFSRAKWERNETSLLRAQNRPVDPAPVVANHMPHAGVPLFVIRLPDQQAPPASYMELNPIAGFSPLRSEE
jgi:hypothetical protein